MQELRQFTFYMTDGRYSVPTLAFELLPDTHSAREVAEKMLAASEHHLSVEVWEDEHRLFTVETPNVT
jgi:hypothetical protein